MQSPRFVHPRFNQHQVQWKPGMPRFGPRVPMLHKNRPTRAYSKGISNFTSTNEEYWCETCDRGFHTLQLLENHKQQHEKCNIDGCQFVAHPKVITRHIQMQHSTGLFKKISKLNNPEEIKKWREERKKRYPTKENIEKKSAEIKEKINRGEKMALRNNGERFFSGKEHGMKRNNRDDFNNRQRFNKFRPRESREINKSDSKTTLDIKQKSLPPKIIKVPLPEDDPTALKPFAGILHLLEDSNEEIIEETPNNDSIEDDEYTLDECNQVNNSKPADPILCGALSSLICNYDFSDDEIENEIEIKHPDKMTDPCNMQNNILNNQDPSSNCKESVNNVIVSKSDDDSGPEEVKIEKTTDVVNNTDTDKTSSIKNISSNENRKRPEKRTKQDNIHNRNNPKRVKSKLPSTLLEKLLQSEIRQERNMILQCIRYIVNNNYFDNKTLCP